MVTSVTVAAQPDVAFGNCYGGYGSGYRYTAFSKGDIQGPVEVFDQVVDVFQAGMYPDQIAFVGLSGATAHRLANRDYQALEAAPGKPDPEQFQIIKQAPQHGCVPGIDPY